MKDKASPRYVMFDWLDRFLEFGPKTPGVAQDTCIVWPVPLGPAQQFKLRVQVHYD